jgi:pilus assembly protein Flp/PilA
VTKQEEGGEMKKLIGFFKEEDGATAVEYALMVALIAAVIIGAVTLLGGNASTKFSETAVAVGSAGTAG